MRNPRGEIEAAPCAAPPGSSLVRQNARRSRPQRDPCGSWPSARRFVREVAWRFVAGEDLAAGLDVIRALNARGIKGTLNHVGTHVRSEAEAIAAADEVIAALRGLDAAGLDSHVSLKLTQIGLDIRPDLCRAQLRRVLDCAREVGCSCGSTWKSPVTSSRPSACSRRCARRTAPSGSGSSSSPTCVQRREDLARLARGGSRIRLVKGGYWEPPEVVYRGKRDVDTAFFVRHRAAPARGTPSGDRDARPGGDRALLAGLLPRTGSRTTRSSSRCCTGFGPDLQDRLVRAGYVVRCYVPYGGQWYEYVLGCLRRVPGGIFQRARDRTRVGALAP